MMENKMIAIKMKTKKLNNKLNKIVKTYLVSKIRAKIVLVIILAAITILAAI